MELRRGRPNTMVERYLLLNTSRKPYVAGGNRGFDSGVLNCYLRKVYRSSTVFWAFVLDFQRRENGCSITEGLLFHLTLYLDIMPVLRAFRFPQPVQTGD